MFVSTNKLIHKLNTMKLKFLPIAAAAFFFTACGGGSEEATTETTTDAAAQEEVVEESAPMTITIDTASSNLMWRGEMLGVKEHTGTLNFTEGSVTVDNGMVTSGSFTVDMTSMMATDENYQPEEGYTKDKLIGHLSSADFFDVATHPTASFEVTSSEGNTLTGNLTVRGTTHEETVTDVVIDNEAGTMTGKLVFDRQKYDVAWSSGAKEMVLADDIELDINLKAQG